MSGESVCSELDHILREEGTQMREWSEESDQDRERTGNHHVRTVKA